MGVQCGDSSKMEGEDFSCQHYRRKCKFVTPCCDGLYRCRFCHDEEQSHTLRRDDVTMVECSQCGERQDVQERCQKCDLQFGQVSSGFVRRPGLMRSFAVFLF